MAHYKTLCLVIFEGIFSINIRKKILHAFKLNNQPDHHHFLILSKKYEFNTYIQQQIQGGECENFVNLNLKQSFAATRHYVCLFVEKKLDADVEMQMTNFNSTLC